MEIGSCCIDTVEDIVYSIRKRIVVCKHEIPLRTVLNIRPSLTRASAQRMRITKVKDDPNDNTINLSILAVRGFNAEISATVIAKLRVNPIELLGPPYRGKSAAKPCIARNVHRLSKSTGK